MKSDFEKGRIGLSILFLFVAIISNLCIWFKFLGSNLFSSPYNYILIILWILGFLMSIVGITKAISTNDDNDAELYSKLSIVWTVVFLQSPLILLSLIN